MAGSGGEADIAARIIPWHERFGRHDLPWQREATAYRIWVSEIMLQQTRVETVLRYFERFVARFPTVADLAAAELDEVLRYWAGLGYYARARNMYRAAGQVMERHDGVFPDDYETLRALPGIGPSTAGAVAALAAGRRHAILDGNVKRVLARVYAVDGWPGERETEKRLWMLAERHTPYQRVASYTQAMMDLGATVCTRSRPSCGVCPLADVCLARSMGEQERYPRPRPRPHRPERATRMLLVLSADGEVLLERRPPAGIWGGLWSLPEPRAEETASQWCRRVLGANAEVVETWAPVRHGFTHFRLTITPVAVRLENEPSRVMDRDDLVWYKAEHAQRQGVAAPVRRLLNALCDDQVGLLGNQAPGASDGRHGEVREAGQGSGGSGQAAVSG